MSDAIPSCAETFSVLDYIKVERMPSRLCPGAFQEKPVLTCPGCKRRGPMPTYLHPFACDCGLTMQIDGAALHVWRERVPA